MRLTASSGVGVVAAAVGGALGRHGIEAVLTGGACASLWSGGRYQSLDLDFVVTGQATRKRQDKAMASLEFVRKGDRYVHPRSRFWVEFPRGPLGIGSDLSVHPVDIPVGRHRIRGLSATDSCRDRLAAFYFWSDRQSLEVAVWIALRNRVNLKRIREWSRDEGYETGFEEFVATLERARAARSNRRRASRTRTPTGRVLGVLLVLICAVPAPAQTLAGFV